MAPLKACFMGKRLSWTESPHDGAGGPVAAPGRLTQDGPWRRGSGNAALLGFTTATLSEGPSRRGTLLSLTRVPRWRQIAWRQLPAGARPRTSCSSSPACTTHPENGLTPLPIAFSLQVPVITTNYDSHYQIVTTTSFGKRDTIYIDL